MPPADVTANEAAGAKATKASLVAETLRREIVAGVCPPGSDLPPETQLMRRFGVSRPSHREALRVLETEGLIRIARGARGGAKVLLPDIDGVSRSMGTYLQMRGATLSELFAARLTYEPAAANAIALRADPEVLSALAQCVAAQEFSVHDRAAFNRQEIRFRSLLLEHCGNAVLALVGGLLEEVFRRHMANLSQRLPPLDWEVDHLTDGVIAKQKLVRLMAAGEADAAERAWAAYIRRYWDRVMAHVGADSPIEFLSAPQSHLVGPAPELA